MKSKSQQLLTFFRQECQKHGFAVTDLNGRPAVKCGSISEAKKVIMNIGLDLVLEKTTGQYWVVVR